VGERGRWILPRSAERAPKVLKPSGARRGRGAYALAAALSCVAASVVGLGPGVTATASAAVTPSHPRQRELRPSSATTSPLVDIAYSLVRDSGGFHPNKGAEFTLLFSAGGRAFLYAADASGALADPGSYSYAGGELSLHFDTADIDVNRAISLSVSASQVTMPFQVVVTKPGTSLWTRKTLGLDQGTFAVFNAEDNLSVGTPTQGQAAAAAYSYAQAWVAAETRGASTDRTGAALATRARHAPATVSAGPVPAAEPPSACAPNGGACVKSVYPLGDDIEVYYTDGSKMLLNLYSWDPEAPSFSLHPSPLASDPRVYLNPSVHPDATSDPPNKTAALIVPFTFWLLNSHTGLTWVKYVYHIANTLKARGYKVNELTGSGTSVKAIVDALKTSPGFVLFYTHGNQAGDLTTGETVESDGGTDPQAFAAARFLEVNRLDDEGLASMVDFHRRGSAVATFELSEQNCIYLPAGPFSTGKLSSCQYNVTLTPSFWQWLRLDQGATFAKSLVFIDACWTDSTNSLRAAIRARAYFAWLVPVYNSVASAVAEYIVDAVARPTHSAEEAYYNILRVVNTGEMIYKEDHDLDYVLTAHVPSAVSLPITSNLDGWAWDGETMVSYRGNGWLSQDVDPGQVWWMLYAGRWDNNAQNGAAALQQCLADYWVHGQPGGLGNTFCNAANAGNLSNKTRVSNDVAYAVYLLDGKLSGDFPAGDVVPRWTLNDGRPGPG